MKSRRVVTTIIFMIILGAAYTLLTLWKKAGGRLLNVAVLGAGAWGTALAKVLHENGHRVTLWTRNARGIRPLKPFTRAAACASGRS